MPLGMASSLDRCEQRCPMIGEVVEVGIWCEQQKGGKLARVARLDLVMKLVATTKNCEIILTTIDNKELLRNIVSYQCK